MTEPPSTLNATAQQPLQASSELASLTTTASSALKPALAPDEPVEDYSIKCICGSTDAEQNTVYCETCDTWQHTECYYIDATGYIPTNDQLEKIEHLCVDCSPRKLDAKRATERQRARQEDYEFTEKKTKKTAAKSHKKKAKPSEANGVLVNGWVHGADSDGHNDRTSRSPHNNIPPSKRTKGNHRSSASTNLPSAPQHGSLTSSHKRAASSVHTNPKFPQRQPTSGVERELCSSEFLRLYDDDPGDKPLNTNSYNDIHITSDLALWTNDIEALRKATPKFTHPDIFQRMEQPINSMQMPELQIQEKTAENITIDGRHPKWKYLTVDRWTPQGAVVGEIKGKIGHMNEYILNPSNRWEYLRHPAPFVFFHPRLPIYIDTRSEGTTCRYLRRSCAPNLAMKTFLENGSDYHFCFIAQCEVDAGSELTIGWVPDENMRRFFDPNHNGVKQEIGSDQEEYIADWASKVLPEFGGCACESSGCTWSRFSKRSHAAAKARNGVSRNQAAAQVSGNSREGSSQDDRRSSSDSKSESRDGSPADANAMDAPGVEISAREKRKIALLEKNFEQLENDKHQPATKKKKRNSGGSHANTPGAGASKQLGHVNSISQPITPGLPSKPQYSDSGTYRRRSVSPISKPSNQLPGRTKQMSSHKGKQRPSLPNTPTPQTSQARKNYATKSIQTDPTESDEEGIKSAQTTHSSSKPYMSLTKRLLIRAQQERQILDQRRRASMEGHGLQAMSHNNQRLGVNASIGHGPQDVEMHDAPSKSPSSAHTPTSGMAEVNLQDRDQGGESIKAPPPPWPSQSQPHKAEQPHDPNGLSARDLPGQPPPKPPEAGHGTQTETPNSSVPHSPLINHHTPATASAASNPSTTSNHVQPSPVPKKMSLSEYWRRKGSSSAHDKPTSASGDPQQPPFKAAAGVNGEGKGLSVTVASSGVEDSAIVDSPKKEITDPMDVDNGKDKDIIKEESLQQQQQQQQQQ